MTVALLCAVFPVLAVLTTAPPDIDLHSVRLRRPWAAFGEMSFSFDGMPAYAAAGVGMERVVGRNLTIDAGIAHGLPSTVATTNGEVRLDPAISMTARARVMLPLDVRQSHALFLGAGPHFSAVGGYGPLWQGSGQLGYQFRAVSGFSFVYAIGLDTVLGPRPAVVDPGTCNTTTCPGPLQRWALTRVIRVGIGYGF